MGEIDEVVANMRRRIEQCRRLARSIRDPAAIEALLKMASDTEADTQRIEAERSEAPPS